MVTLFSGEVNSGKTTALLQNYQQTLKGNGFLSIKTMEGSSVKCYDALELSTGKQLRLAYHENFRPKAFSNALTLGPYSFDVKVFNHIEETILKWSLAGVTPIYLDEIGMLELYGRGFARILKNLVENKMDTVIGVRSDLVLSVLEGFKIGDYRLISVNRKEEKGCTI